MSKGPPIFSIDGSQVKCDCAKEKDNVNLHSNPASTHQMLLIHPMRHSPTSGHFPQLAQKVAEVTTVAGEKEPTALTHGTFDVTKIVAWDEDHRVV